jgi:hypothetical protein
MNPMDFMRDSLYCAAVIVERRLSFGLGACALLLLGTIAIFFWPMASGRVPVYRDILDITVPLGQYIGGRLREGKLPQWFPYDGLGEPLIGQLNESAFHPATWLYAMLPVAAALRGQLLLGYLAAAFGQLLFARKLGLSWTACALAAVAFAFSGYAISLSNVVPYLWGVAALPWVGLFAAEVCTRERPWPWLAALSLSWATIVVAGDSHSALFGGVVALFAAAQTGRLRRLPLCVLASLVAVALAGAELLPALDIVREGPRTRWDSAEMIERLSGYWALHPHRLPELLFPGWFPPRLDSTFAGALYGESGVWALSIYAGASVVALALVGIAGRTRTALMAGAVALFGLWMAAGRHGGLDPLLRHLPLLGALRYPEKFLGLWTLGLPLTAASGLDRLRERPRWSIPVALCVAAAACALSALLLPADAATRIWPELARHPEHAATLHQTWHAALLQTGLLLLATAAVVALARGRPALLTLLPLLVFVDLAAASGSLLRFADPRLLTEPARFCVAAWREGAGPDGLRVLDASTRPRTTDERDDPDLWTVGSLNELSPAESALCRIGSIWNNSVLSNEPRWVRWAIGHQHLEASAALPLYGFGLVVRAEPRDPPLKDETVIDALPVAPGESLLLVRRPAAPRAYAAVPHWAPDGAAALRDVEEHGLALVESPVLAGSGPAFSGSGSAGTVRIASYQPEHVVLEAQMTRSGAVILNDLAARGWTATVDGAPAPIYRANVLARGVLLPEGNHRIEMKYQLPRLRAGLAVSGASLLLCVILLLAGPRHRRPASGAGLDAGSGARETA